MPITPRQASYREPASDYLAPLAVGLLVFVAVLCTATAFVVWLLQPTVVPNRGLAAYEPPPGTSLIPPPHKMDAPALAELAPEPAATEAPAATPAKTAEAKPAKTKVAHSASRPRRQRDDYYDRNNSYADSRWSNGWGRSGGGFWSW